MDCYTMVQESGKAAHPVGIRSVATDCAVVEQSTSAAGDGVDLSPGEHSLSAGKVRDIHKYNAKERRGQLVIQWGAGVGLSQGERSLPADKVREGTTISMRGWEGQSVNPVGQWSGFEEGRAHTSCRQSQRIHKYNAKERRVQLVNPMGRWDGFESGRALTFCRQSKRKLPQVQGKERRAKSEKAPQIHNARRGGSVSQSNGAIDCYVTVKGSRFGQDRTPCQNRTRNISYEKGQFNGAMDCYATVQESWERLAVAAVLSLIAQIPPPCKVEDNFSRFVTLHWRDGLGLSQGKRSHTAGKVRESTTSSRRGEEGGGQALQRGAGVGLSQGGAHRAALYHKFNAKERVVSNSTGRWSGFESGRALTYCRQSQRKHHKFKGRRQGVGQSFQWGDGVDLSHGEHSHTAGKVRESATSSMQRRQRSQTGGAQERSLHWGDGMGLSQGEPSQPAGKVRESSTSSRQGEKGQ
eukprot:200131-Prymnesium_polylepis.2